MMSNYVIAVYVSSDPGTYMVRIRLPAKTGCDNTPPAFNVGAHRLPLM
jgi:hypothetical protein